MAGIIGEALVAIRPDTTALGAGGIEDKLKGMLGGAGPLVAGIGGAAIGAGAALLEIGNKFQESFNTIQTGTGATGAQLKGLEGSFKDILASGPESMKVVAGAMTDVAQRTNLTGTNLQDLTTTMLQLSRVTKTDVTGNIDATQKAFANWSVAGVKPMTADLNAFLTISQQTRVPVAQLASDVTGKAGAAFRAMGTSITGAAQIMGNLDEAGVPATAVITGLQKAITAGAKAGEPANKVMTTLFSTLSNAHASTAATADAIKDLGAKGFLTLRDAVQNGQLALGDFTGSVAATGPTIANMAAQQETLGEKFATLKNKAMVALQPIATKFLDFTMMLADKVGPAVESVMKFLKPLFAAFESGFSGGGGKLTGIAGTFQSFGKIVAGIVKQVQSDMPAVINIFDKVAPILETIGKFILKMDLKQLIAGFKILGAAFKVVGDVIKIVSDLLSGHFSKALKDVGKLFSDFGGLILTVISQVFSVFASFPAKILGYLGDAAAGLLGFFASLPGLAVKGLVNLAEMLGRAFLTAFSALASALPGMLGDVGAFFLSIPGRLLTLMGDVGKWFLGVGTRVLKGLYDDFVVALPIIARFFLDLPGKELSVLLGVGKWLVGVALRVATDLFNDFVGALPTIGNFFLQLPDKILGFVNSVMGKLGQIGVNIIDGIIQGLASVGNKVADFIGNMLSKIPGYGLYKKIFGSSPAPFFAPIGVNIMDGIALGVVQNGTAPALAMANALASNPPTIPGTQLGGLTPGGPGATAGASASVIQSTLTQSLAAHQQQVILLQQIRDALVLVAAGNVPGVTPGSGPTGSVTGRLSWAVKTKVGAR